jgi:hypothetical protein
MDEEMEPLAQAPLVKPDHPWIVQILEHWCDLWMETLLRFVRISIEWIPRGETAKEKQFSMQLCSILPNCLSINVISVYYLTNSEKDAC